MPDPTTSARTSHVLKVNGRTLSVEAPAHMPLLWVLRDELGLTGTKYGCGQGLCGACTVHLDGEAVRACQLSVGEIGTRAVLTIEGLAGEQPHPLQAAWIQEQVPQCGFCQSGQIMSAAALLAKQPHASDEEIDAAMAGNLCRCGTYVRIRRAIRSVAGGASPREVSR